MVRANMGEAVEGSRGGFVHGRTGKAEDERRKRHGFVARAAGRQLLRRRHIVNTSASLKRSPLTFFVLVFALSLLFWLLVELLSPLTEHFSPALPIAIPSGFNPVSPLVVEYMPLIAACILVPEKGNLVAQACS